MKLSIEYTLNWLRDHEARIAMLEASSKKITDNRVNWTPRDYVVATGGVIFVLLALIGKISWLDVAGHMIGIR